MSKKKRRRHSRRTSARSEPGKEKESADRVQADKEAIDKTDRSKSHALFLLVYGCVVISGAAALIYEVIWARRLAQFLGITAHAHAAVLTAFMTGLALGSYLIGARADRIAKPLRAYALLELGIGVYALLTLFLFDWAKSLYVATARVFGVTGWGAHGSSLALAFAILLVPTFLMGGTLPLLIRGLSGKGVPLSKLTARLYGFNTLGATLGAFLGGFFLLSRWGLAGTTCFASGLALLAAFFVLSQSRKREEDTAADAEADPPGKIAFHFRWNWILAGFAVSGFAAMIYQLSWIRALTLVIGGSVYAFSTTLTTFLAGIALGSFAVNRFAGSYSRDRNLHLAGWLQTGIALSATAGLWLIGKLPDFFLKGYQSGIGDNFSLYLGFIFLLCFGVMFLPTFLLGSLFPLIASTWAKQSGSIGKGIGTAYAANSAGTILGAFGGGLLIVPLLGIHGSTFLAAGASAAAGCIFWLQKTRQDERRFLRIGGVLAAVAMLCLLVPRWDKAVMTSGVFYHTKWFTEQGDWHQAVRERTMLYYKEGPDGVVCVTESDDNRILHINGKPDGSNAGDLSTQILLAQIPMLMHPAPKKAAVIGLGTGTTPAGVATQKNLERLDVIEISPEVVEASHFFRDINRDVLDDPRTVLTVADARNVMLASNANYDVIISEPSNPWISGVANMFTREFFQLAESRLAEDGIMSQWIHCYNMAPEDLKGIIRTFQSVFGNVSLWMPALGDFILIGSKQPHGLHFDRVSSALKGREVRSMMTSVGRESLEKIASAYLLGNAELKKYAGDASLNTDDRPRLEFSAPRYLYSRTTEKNLAGIMKFLGSGSVTPPVKGLTRVGNGVLEIPSLELKVHPSSAPIEDVKIVFAVNHQMEKDGIMTAVAQHLLQWREGGAALISLAASTHAEPWAAQEREAVLSSAMTRGKIEKGEVTLPGGERANWVGDGSMIGLAWSAPVGDGHYRDIFSLRRAPSLSADKTSLQETAKRFADQFVSGSIRE